MGAGALMISLIENNPDIKFTFYIAVSEDDIQAIQQHLEKRLYELYGNKNLKIVLKTFNRFAKFQELRKRVNHRMAVQCARLFIDEYFKDEGTVLYADVDMVNISPLPDFKLFLFPLADTAIRASKGAGMRSKTDRVCGTEVTTYFWSSLLSIDIKKWQNAEIGNKAIENVIKYRPILPDQDALNAAAIGKFSEFTDNFQSMWQVKHNTVFLHYPWRKPWEPWHYNHHKAETKFFRKYAKIFAPNVCDWISFRKNKKVFINYYNNRFATKYLAKVLFRRGFFRAAVFYYLRHYYIKVRQKGILGILLLKSNSRT